MKVLLIYPEFPITFWGLQYGLQLIGKKALFPPLGLLTLAALLPNSWDLTLVDLNIDALTDRALLDADLVLCGGMLIQADSINEIIARAHDAGKRIAIGGPAPTTAPDLFPDADVLFQGETEGRVEELVAALETPAMEQIILPAPVGFPKMAQTRPPRFDLIDVRRYGAMSIQYSRGCPFHCEFCDIVEIYGKVPRVKSPEQVLDEFELLLAAGHRGLVFMVDDNFIGNRKAVMQLLPEVMRWQTAHGFPFELITEASLNLASDKKLLEGMVTAGFSGVFLGIESPSEVALKDANKLQNLRMDLTETVSTLTKMGLEVMGGFIVGFDSDDAGIFAIQEEFIQSQPIPFAMVGLLSALPGTQLWHRMEREGRMRDRSTGDQFERPNFVPSMDELTLLQGYSKLIRGIFTPTAYYARVERFIAEVGDHPVMRSITWRELTVFLQIVFKIGVLSPRRRQFWHLLAAASKRGPKVFHQAVAHALHGEHLIRYAQEQVVPRLERTIESLRQGRGELSTARP